MDHKFIRPAILLFTLALGLFPSLQANNQHVVEKADIQQTQISQTRDVQFAGYQWQIKHSNHPVGPGPNYFSNANERIWVDDDGLHLTITEQNGRWYCTEAINRTSLGYGTYIIKTRGRVDQIDPRMIVGIFTWDTSAPQHAYREIDLEFARWGNPNHRTNSQYVVQPCSACPGCADRCQRFNVNLTDSQNELIHILKWQSNKVEWKTYRGNAPNSNPPPSALIHQWTYDGPHVPPAGDETFRFNFWLMNGNPPLNGNEDEMIITDFEFTPLTSIDTWEKKEE